jgi:DNA-binding YbaB/EbfC family protein
MNQLMKQAQSMQKKMAELEEKMASTEFTGTSGGGMVTVTVTGKGLMTSIKIDPSLIEKDDIEILEDLIKAAFNDAKKKVDASSEGEMSGALGGMNLPFKMPF